MRISVVRRVVLPATLFALLVPGSASAQQYHRTDLTADSSAASATAPNLDTNLVNAWGLSRASGSPWWVSDNGTGLSTLYNAAGAPQALVVTIPTPDGTGTSAPTGTVFNATPGFLVGPGAKAFFLFVTEDGTIAGWNPTVNPNTVILKNRAGKAVYKGCTIAQVNGSARFYATNFQTGRVEVFDNSFNRLHSEDDDAFRFPGLDMNWSPFNIQNVGGDWVNAPWGAALAPGDFGKFSHRLLIGNFGDGMIHGFNLFTGNHEGMMIDDITKQALTIDGLWAISFGGVSATNNGQTNTLFFTAGPNDEANGLLGTLTATQSEQPGNSQ